MAHQRSHISQKGTDYKELLKPYLKNWKWFIASVILCVVAALIYIRYATPEYQAQAKIKIIEDTSSTSELSAFQDLQFFSGSNTKVEDEIEILNSRSNMIEVAKRLGLNVRIFSQGKISNTELYQDPPFKVNFLVPDSLVNQAQENFFITILSSSNFSFRPDDEDAPEKVYSFGKNIESEMGSFEITPSDPEINQLANRQFEVRISPITQIAQEYKDKLEVAITGEFSNIVTISLKDRVKQKAIDIVNALIETYNRNAVLDKKLIADRTSEFINDRIADIYGDLSTVDQSAEEFKSGRGITDVASQSNLSLNMSAASRQELQNANIQLNIASSMQSIVENQEGYEVLPANIGLSDPTIANTTARYNDLVMERNRLLKSSNEKNPVIVNLNQQLEGLKNSLQSSLSSVTNNLGLQVNNLSNQLSQANAKIYAAPRNERALRDITRQQQTTESLYLYLLQKREESQIGFASASPKSKIIDNAYSVSPLPVSPKRPIVLLASLIFGLLLPFSVIYASEMLDNKIHNKVNLEQLVGDIPVLAEIPKLGRNDNILVKSGERTVLAESLRILRTNLDYLINSKSKASGSNIIYVTSSVPEEGKTLVSSNLSMILANTGKKVLLIGADIRNPKLYQFYSNLSEKGKPIRRKDGVGLTEFLIDPTIKPHDIISNMEIDNNHIDVIYSGRIPPNPAELLMSNRFEELFTDLSLEYDYIVVDTAPLMVVTDTLLISKYADQILYVVRANVTEKKVLEYPIKLHEEGKLNGLAFVVNGVRTSELGYGGKYGYGYGKAIKKWWKF